MEQAKPRVFIASSVEGLPIAEAINANLDHSTFPTLWKDGTFHLGSHSLESLVKKSSVVDFAIFVFTPDDVVEIREKKTPVVRDNVLFELGLFVGAIGKDRCYIVRPRNTEMHLPSDLLGITTADYATDRGDGEWFSALNAACTKIKTEIARLGIFRAPAPSNTVTPAIPVANPTVYQIRQLDYLVLGIVARTHVTDPGGMPFYSISNEMGSTPHSIVAVSLTKLLKMGCVERNIGEDNHGNSYYLFCITEDGIELLLANESEIHPSLPAPQPARRSPTPPKPFDDDIPY